jgi:hypothetical protein
MADYNGTTKVNLPMTTNNCIPPKKPSYFSDVRQMVSELRKASLTQPKID